MRTQFRDRTDAGELLAIELAKYANRPDVIVLALPRGGVPVAYEVAQRLNAPLDLFVVRKLGVPGQEELAMGAIATGGVRVMNESVVRALKISDESVNSVAAREERELRRRELEYRGHHPPPSVKGRTVIVVDDGVATGSTMYAAISALRNLGAGRIVIATPTIARSTYHEMRPRVDDLVTVMLPEEFSGVGQWYENFSQTTDAEVRELLAHAFSSSVSR